MIYFFKRYFFKYHFFILSGVLISLTGIILLYNPNIIKKNSVFVNYIYCALKGNWSSGSNSGKGNNLDLNLAKPGDILLGGKPGTGWGHFSHAALYLGDGYILQGFVDWGVTLGKAQRYHEYDWACILRVKVSPEGKFKAINYALEQRSKAFHILALKPGERYWNCTKIVWAAYKKAGVNLDSKNDLWITPDAIFNSPNVEVVASEGGEGE